MLLCISFIVFTVSPAFTHVLSETENTCASDEFRCQDGGCVPLTSICDGNRDCFDGTDELSCDGIFHSLQRSKRQASTCRKNQWQCRDGTCIGFDGKCDGIVDCPDGSDETHALCRMSKCQSNWFRCTYGACVDGTAPCNGIKECADESDELLPRCRNETDEVSGRFKCASGQTISAFEHCDGVKDCDDGSDETVRACAAKTCASYLFQCAYGACVDQGSDCNGKQECADGSDESDELCNRISAGTPKPPVTVKPIDIPISQGGKCVLPPFPEYGTYTMGGNPNPSPGQTFPNVFLNITCNPGFGVENDINSLYCFDGVWSDIIPKCVRFCRLHKHASVEYRCRLTGSTSLEGSRECGPQEPAGTVVRPVCRAPNYYNSGILDNMRCIDGSWTYIAICKPGGITNITININDSIKIHITSGNNNSPNIEINTGSDSNIKVQSNSNVNLKVVPTQNGNIEIISTDNNGNTQNIHTDRNIDTQYWPTGSYDTQNRPYSSNIDTQNKPTTNKYNTQNNDCTQYRPTVSNYVPTNSDGTTENVNVNSSTDFPSVNDIDEGDWRMAQVSVANPKDQVNYDSNSSAKPNDANIQFANTN